MEYPSYDVNVPQWREITVGSHLPAGLEPLAEIAHNFWWSWHYEALGLYASMDPELWEETKQNPVMLLERMNYEKLEELAEDKAFLEQMNALYTK